MRIVRRGSGKTKTEARAKLKEVLRDHEDGLAIAPPNFTVADAVNDWLTYGLNGRSKGTRDNYRMLARTHIIADLGARKLREFSATDVDKWLAAKAKTLSTRTLRLLHSILNRAMARDKVKRNVVALCGIPTGQEGRPSKSLTLDQAKALLAAAEASRLRAYIVVSLLTRARTEELRALDWDHVDLDGRPDDDPPVPASISVWHSVRAGGDTKTKKSRRTLALPLRCVAALMDQRKQQRRDQADAIGDWRNTGLVFASKVGTALDAHNVRRGFRQVAKAAGLDPIAGGKRSEPQPLGRAVRPHLANVRYAATVPVIEIDLDASPADMSGRRTSPRPALGVLALVLVLAAVTGEPVARTPARLPLPVIQPVRCQPGASTGGWSASAPDTPDAVVVLDARTGQNVTARIHCADR
jgi:integrase